MKPKSPLLYRNLYFFASFLLIIIAFSDAIDFLMTKWLDFDHGAYNHGFLLLGVAIFLFFKHTDVRALTSNQYALPGFIVTLILLLLTFFLDAVNIVSIQVLLIYFMLASLMLTFFGSGVAKKAILPFAILIFALPIWDFLGPILQNATANMAYLLVKISGIPVLKEEYYLIVPAGSFEVAPSCSGLSYFMAAVPLAVIYAVQNFNSGKYRLIIVFGIMLAAIVSNWFRVLIIIIAGQMTNMEHSLVHDHFNLGWIIFGGFFIGLMFLFNRVLIDEAASEGNSVPTINAAQASRIPTNYLVAILSVLIGVIGLEQLNSYDKAAESNITVSAFDLTIPSGFYSVDYSPILDRQRLPGEVRKLYMNNRLGAEIYLYQGVFPNQQQGAEIVSDMNEIVDRSRWRRLNQDVVTTEFGNVNRYELESRYDGRAYIIWQWYLVDGKHTASDLLAKLYEFLGYIKRDNSGAFIMLAAERSVANDKFLSIYSTMAR